MMETRPSASLVVAEPDFLLELLVIALDAPAHFGDVDQTSEGNLLVEGREPILGGLRLALGPLDQQRLLGSFCGAPDGRGAHPHASEARAKRIGRALPPCDRAPSMFRQAERQLLD